MRALIVFESMYGCTHDIADAIARGVALVGDVTTVPVSHAIDEDTSVYDLVIVGGPTHVHGMSRESTRRGAVEAADQPDSELTVEPDAAGAGIRDWLGELSRREGGCCRVRYARRQTRDPSPGRASEGDREEPCRSLGFHARR